MHDERTDDIDPTRVEGTDELKWDYPTPRPGRRTHPSASGPDGGSLAPSPRRHGDDDGPIDHRETALALAVTGVLGFAAGATLLAAIWLWWPA